MSDTVYVGIDVSKNQLVVDAVNPDEAPGFSQIYRNDTRGIKSLLKRLVKLKTAVHVCLEPTSIYHLELAWALHTEPRTTVSVVNPKAFRDFVASQLVRAKTDGLDAAMLAKYARVIRPEAWQPPRASCFRLRTLSRHLVQLIKEQTALKNRLHSRRCGNSPQAVLTDLRQALRAQAKRIERIQAAAVVLIEGDAELSRQFKLLLSIKGIAERSAVKILGEVCCLPEGLTKKQWVAAAGLDPKVIESGSSIHKRRQISKLGSVYLRIALNQPALVAAHNCTAVKAFYHRVQARGNSKMSALCAVMRKLLQAIWGMFNTDTAFDPSLFCQCTC
jgi:transposase